MKEAVENIVREALTHYTPQALAEIEFNSEAFLYCEDTEQLLISIIAYASEQLIKLRNMRMQ